MPQEIAIRTSLPPQPQTREFRDLLGVYRNRIETTPSGQSSISLAPAGSDLVVINRRRHELALACRPVDIREEGQAVVAAISRLFLRFPSTRVADPAATAAVYAGDLAEFPYWAIEAGLTALLRGHGLTSRDFAPSSIVVRDAVLAAMSRVHAEAAMIDSVLAAKPKPPLPSDAGRRAAALANALDFVSGAKAAQANAKRGRMTDKEIADAKALSAAIVSGRDTRPMPPLSPYLRAKLNLDHVDMVPNDIGSAEDAA